ncbi:hypothetical protein F511_36648 [Dorcoceras hygrometricum]|uniref:Uncharacterized protein n=1 Tax=Dorcoceras hygrometricum TaxID=472368 RepID=A0A2Z7CU51_9LAMI|nr:hypothetical protein F511_36648 [Dorcoceras hygrometricum]
MPVLEAERITLVTLISLLGSVSHYEEWIAPTPQELGNSSCSPYWGLTPCPSGLVLFACVCFQVIMVTQLVVELTQLEAPQEVMPPRRRGRGRWQFQKESEGQNEEVQRSVPRRGRDRQVEIEVDELAARVDDMELVMARFQRMNPQTFNRDQPSSDAKSWLQHISEFF